MAEGRNQQELQRRYQDIISDFDQVDQKLIQKAADSCAETCIGNNFNDSELVNACMRKCERFLPLINQTVQQELTNLQGRMQLCALDCSDKMAEAIPAGTKEGDPAMHRGSLQNMECTAACATRAASLVSRTLEKITAAADLAARGK
eukprot:g4460.t1